MERLISSGGIYGQINLAVEEFMDRLMSTGGIYGQSKEVLEEFMDRLMQQWRDLWID